MSDRLRQRWINIGLVVAVLGTFGVMAAYYFSRCDAYDCPSVEQFVRGFGSWGPLAFGLIYIISSPVPFLAPVLSAAGGLLFGTVLGTLYTLAVATLSSLVPFSLARRLGREWVESKLKGRRLADIYEQSGGRTGFLFILLMRLIPILPWEVQNYVAGLSKVSLPPFLLATLLGIVPGTFSLVFLGAAVRDPTSWRFYAAIGLKIVTALIPVVAIFIRSRRGRQRGGARPRARE